jgi:integrase
MRCSIEKHKGIFKLSYRNHGKRVRLTVVGRSQSPKPYEYKMINMETMNQAEKYIDFYFKEHKIYPPVNVFKQYFQNHRERNISSESLLDYYKQFVTEWKIEHGKPLDKYNNFDHVAHMIDDYQTYTGKPLFVSDLNMRWINIFYQFITTKRNPEEVGKKKGRKYWTRGDLGLGTVLSRFQRIRSFWLWLETNYYQTYDEAFGKKISLIESKVNEVKKYAPTIKEINFLGNLELPDAEDNIVKEYSEFLFHTGMRYSDFSSLKMNHVHESGNGFEVRKIAVKTKKEFRVYLNERALNIIHKYKPELPNRPIFDKYTCNQLNVQMKKVLGKTGIFNAESSVKNEKGSYKKNYELICTSSGRKAFICNALDLDVPYYDIMNATGHQMEIPRKLGQ